MFIIDQINQELNEGIQDYVKKTQQAVKLHPVKSAIALAVIFRFAKSKYDRYLSAAARRCRARGENVPICMNLAKAKALDMELNTLRSMMGQCNNARDPERCRKAISKKIQKILDLKMKYVTASKVMKKSKF